MRITGGSARGRHLIKPKAGWTFIRPTGDRVREALFSILGEEVLGSTILDLYAGTGALGLEALSRGAETVVFVDQSRQALELIHGNLTNCFPAAKASLQVLNLSQEGSLGRLKRKMPAQLLFDIVFLDPPYEKKLAEKTVAMVEREDLLKDNGLVVAEERASEQLAEQYGTLSLESHRSYGETGLWLYRNTVPS
ncbi:MAG: 16S rRNA (guanine(966)-N(2))-methyltransferase RsmD [Candidatus Electrothrix aestuarii]|uniref:16S rRNA (Guanine(966)-N(2))-methyltransferase RsmD n=1 Tax=Candidatus Electrothrix aestuarii TaxID=3062594 RepID=A0AAU8LYN4_9BACT|nr:16S rRNA (guanine(966)-N(2))-methyltransferase RsmD [Candidatus Electrothrix aestuarii]WPD23046.1 MAG: 16S rRNA (guanine(966)-N(2))-methyltransferase RsmD [Candidatus Electrothrix sp. GW3-3]